MHINTFITGNLGWIKFLKKDRKLLLVNKKLKGTENSLIFTARNCRGEVVPKEVHNSSFLKMGRSGGELNDTSILVRPREEKIHQPQTPSQQRIKHCLTFVISIDTKLVNNLRLRQENPTTTVFKSRENPTQSIPDLPT